jgi:hypothetical protein
MNYKNFRSIQSNRPYFLNEMQLPEVYKVLKGLLASEETCSPAMRLVSLFSRIDDSLDSPDFLSMRLEDTDDGGANVIQCCDMELYMKYQRDARQRAEELDAVMTQFFLDDPLSSLSRDRLEEDRRINTQEPLNENASAWFFKAKELLRKHISFRYIVMIFNALDNDGERTAIMCKVKEMYLPPARQSPAEAGPQRKGFSGLLSRLFARAASGSE